MKALGFTVDIDPAVNNAYFVMLNGVAANTYDTFITTQEFLPAQTIPNVPTFLINDRDFKKANSGYLIQADLVLECIRNARGGYKCPYTRYVHNKVCFLKPMIFNPLVLDHYLPTGEIAISAAYDHPRPDRDIKIPINIIRMQDIAVRHPVLSAPGFPGFPPHFGGQGPSGQGPSGAPPPGQPGQGFPMPPFPIYRDNSTTNADQSTSSTVSLPTPNQSSSMISGNLERQPSGIASNQSSFNPPATSTKSPRGSNADPYANPQPGPSGQQANTSGSGFIIENVRSLKKTPKKSPRKTPRKSPRRLELRRTPSQPSIRDYTRSARRCPIRTPKRKGRPSPNVSPTSSRPPKVKRILSDLTLQEREEAARLERSLRRQDSGIKEATIDPSTLPSMAPPTLTPPTSGSSATSSSNSTLPSMSEVETSKDVSLSQIQPSLLSQEEERGSSASTSNEAGQKEMEEEDEEPQGNVRYVGVRNDVNDQQDDAVIFDIANAIVARGSLAGAPSPEHVPDQPEHVLIVVEDPDVITHVINFSTRHQPEDILQAFWSNSLNLTLPDEGIENTAEVTPSAPPPTPSSSTEAVQGSSDNPQIDSNTESTINTSSDASVLILNGNVIDHYDSKGEDHSKDEEEEGERRI